MVQMEFYTTNFYKRENSTKQPTGGTVIPVVFKDEFSILGGTIKLQVPFFMGKKFVAARYDMHYYKVVDVVCITNDIVEVDLELDVLASYKDEIGRYTSLIERSPSNEKVFDIVDNTIAPLATNKKYYETANVYPPSNGLEGVCFQIKTKNGNGDLAYFLSPEGFDNLLGKFEAAFWTDETQYIISTKVVPIPASKCGGTSSSVYIGNQQYNITSGVCYAIKSQNYLLLGKNSVNTSRLSAIAGYPDERRYNNNYVRLQCKLNGDIIDLDANYLRHTSFITESYIDPITLDVRLEVKVKANDHDYLIAATHTNIGMGFMFTDVPNSLDMIVAAMSSMPKLDTLGLSGDAAHVPESAFGAINLKGVELTYDKIFKMFKQIGVKSTLGSAVCDIGKATAAAISTGYNAGMRASTAGAPSGSSIAGTMYGEITFYITVYNSTDANPTELGYPYMKKTSIEKVGLKGYYKFVAPQISMQAMPSIKNAINEYLANGFFYE